MYIRVVHFIVCLNTVVLWYFMGWPSGCGLSCTINLSFLGTRQKKHPVYCFQKPNSLPSPPVSTTRKEWNTGIQKYILACFVYVWNSFSYWENVKWRLFKNWVKWNKVNEIWSHVQHEVVWGGGGGFGLRVQTHWSLALIGVEWWRTRLHYSGWIGSSSGLEFRRKNKFLASVENQTGNPPASIL